MDNINDTILKFIVKVGTQVVIVAAPLLMLGGGLAGGMFASMTKGPPPALTNALANVSGVRFAQPILSADRLDEWIAGRP